MSLATQQPLKDDDALAVLTLRNLIFDICNQNGGGHGGSAIGMAAVGVALWKYIMRYNPSNPEWFDRDRFVLSNGVASVRSSLFFRHYDIELIRECLQATAQCSCTPSIT